MEAFNKQLLEELNKFRKDPSSLCKKLELGRIGLSRMSNTEKISRSLETLIRDLSSMKSLPLYNYSVALSKGAEKMLDVVDKNTQAGRGKELESRLRTVVTSFKDVVCLADNGSEEPSDVITRLCLDKKDLDRINEKILVSFTYKYVGIASRTYDGDDKLVAIVFADYVEDINSQRPKSKFTLTDWELAEIRKAFDLFDVEGLGRINVSDVKETFQRIGYDTNYENFYKFVASLEHDKYVECNDGYIDYDGLVSILADQYADYFSDNGLKNIFELFVDENRGKVISFSTFKRLTDELGYFFDDVTVKQLFNRISQNGREITFNEFKDIMTSF